VHSAQPMESRDRAREEAQRQRDRLSSHQVCRVTTREEETIQRGRTLP